MAINPTAIWRVRPSGSNANGGGYDPGIASPGTDYSQQNAAQVTFDGVTITASTAGVSDTITITGYTPAATDVANAVQISGGVNFIVGFYYIVSTGVGTWTLDRNCTTGAGSAMTGAMGGGWADFWTNVTTGKAALVPGNTVYILGSGTPNPSAYSYDYVPTINIASVFGDYSTNGYITYANDPSTPGYKAPPDTTGGMPCIQYGNGSNNHLFLNPGQIKLMGLYCVSNTGAYVIFSGNPFETMFGCVVDQHGDNAGLFGGGGWIEGCEVFSSIAPGSPTANYAVDFSINSQGGNLVVNCNIHDTCGPGIFSGRTAMISRNIIAKCRGIGISVQSDSLDSMTVSGNTIDGNTGGGLLIQNSADHLALVQCWNNLITNHTGAGTYGISVGAGTAAVNDKLKAFFDYNSFYNNSANYNAISASPHDTQLITDPYVAQSTENYTLA